MQTILENRDGIREKLIEAGYNRAKEFSWENHAGKIIQLYKEASND